VSTDVGTDELFEVVTVGEALVVLATDSGNRLASAETVTMRSAGAEVNLARTMARMGSRVAWAGAVGTDPFGDRVVADLMESGVDVSHVTRDPSAPTGIYFKDTDANQSTSVFYYRSGSAASKLDARFVGGLPRSRVLHLSGITAAISDGGVQLVEAALLARQRESLLSFDVNYRPTLWGERDAAGVLAQLANSADLVFVGLDEAALLWGTVTVDDIRALLPHPSTVIVKDGEVGATSLSATGTVFEPSPKIDVVEVVGAGDAFAAGYLHALLAGRSERERLQRGHEAAGRALTTTDDVGAALA
jgi:2-dehydro-3-deoxygluconokinase